MIKYDTIISQIKNIENKATDKYIEEILRNINDSIFNIYKAYITPNITTSIQNNITNLAQQLKTYKPKNNLHTKRQEEILTKTRELYKQLKNIYYNTEDIDANIIANQKYQLYKYINNIKPNADNIQLLISFLTQQKQYMHPTNIENNYKQYNTMIAELKNTLIDKITNY